MTERTLTPEQRKWCKKYKSETTFEPLIDNFLEGHETFEEAARNSIKWFEDWSGDALLIVSHYPSTEGES